MRKTVNFDSQAGLAPAAAPGAFLISWWSSVTSTDHPQPLSFLPVSQTWRCVYTRMGVKLRGEK